jgi:hypothetical protein
MSSMGPAGGNTAGASMAELREDIAETRQDLGGTVEALADKADVKSRAKKSAKETADQMRDSAQDAAEQVKRPRVWGPAAAGLAALVGVVTFVRWRKARNTPQRRAMRAWHKVADPSQRGAERAWRKAKNRFGR